MQQKIWFFILFFSLGIFSVQAQLPVIDISRPNPTPNLPPIETPPFTSSQNLEKACGPFQLESSALPIADEQVISLPPSIPPNPSEEPTPPAINHEDRLVFWLHGLGGTPEDWAKVADASQNNFIEVENYSARQIRSAEPSYEDHQNATLNLAANQLRFVMEGIETDFSDNLHPLEEYDSINNFIIAHSQGGLVARWLDLLYTVETPEDRIFGGIVTFGTPHGGSFLAKQESEELLKEIAGELCTSLTVPQVLEAIDESTFTRLIVNLFADFGSVAEFIENGCVLSSNAITLLLAAQNKAIRNDYIPGAPALDVLRAHDESKEGVSEENKVAFYGVESEPVLWNTANALMNNPGLAPVFSANDDGGTADWAMAHQEAASMKVIEWNRNLEIRQRRESEDCGFPNVFLFLPCFLAENSVDRARNIKNNWEAALNFWNTANDKYKIAIGALEIPILEDNTVCICESGDPGGGAGSFSLTLPGPCAEGSSCRTVENVVLGAPNESLSDGVVTDKSAMDYLGAKAVKMEGSNHLQMRNDENTRRGLNQLWDGDHGRYFITDKKQ